MKTTTTESRPLISDARAIRNYIVNMTRRVEQTEAHIFAHAADMGISAETTEAAIDELVGAGIIRSTICAGALNYDGAVVPSLVAA